MLSLDSNEEGNSSSGGISNDGIVCDSINVIPLVEVDDEGDLVDNPREAEEDDGESFSSTAAVSAVPAAKPTGGAEAKAKSNGNAEVAKEYKSRKSTASQYAAS